MAKRAAILCLSEEPDQRLWEEYCSGAGGVRYEFEFSPERPIEPGISFGDVTYNDDKPFRLIEFLAREIPNRQIASLLTSQFPLTNEEKEKLIGFLDDSKYSEIRHAHLTRELAFKKTTNYSYEHEFRYAHLFQSEMPLDLNMRKQMAPLSELGLTLIRISTNDVSETCSRINSREVEIRKI